MAAKGIRSDLDYRSAFEAHHGPLFRYLHRLTGDADVAEDVAQESFVRLLDESLPEDRVRSWLFTVATNLVRDRARIRSRRRELHRGRDLEPEPGPRPDEEVERSERIRRVRAALDRLPRRDRAMLLMREEGFKYAEIAEVADVATSSVGTLLGRALRRFEEAYGRGAERESPVGAGSAENRREPTD